MSATNLTAEKSRLAQLIDNHVGRFPETLIGEDDIEALKMLMESTTAVLMGYLSLQLPGLYRYAKLLESLSQGIADGKIEAPADH